MSKPARKRYWRNWKTVEVPKKNTPENFKSLVSEWAQHNRTSIIIREGSTRVKDEWGFHYNSHWKCHIQHGQLATMFMLKWG